MKSKGVWKQKIGGVMIEITIANKEAEYLAEGCHRGGGTCEDAGDLLGLVANAMAHVEAANAAGWRTSRAHNGR